MLNTSDLDSKFAELVSTINLETEITDQNFLIELYYFLPYNKKNSDLENKVYDSLIESQISEDFEIEQRVVCSNLNVLDSDFNILGEFVKTLLKHVEIDLIFDDCNNQTNEDLLNDYIHLSECHINEQELNEVSDTKIITTEVSKIEGLTYSDYLLNTPPGINIFVYYVYIQ